MATARRTSTVEKDPAGGLTAAGRAAFKARDGSKLKPGVTKADADMTPEDMKRKGSWAVRFYGRDPLPPLVDAKGRPTRLALSAHAWGEKVPKTESEARRIAEKGRRLLARYEKAKQSAAKAPARRGAAVKAGDGAGAKKAVAKHATAATAKKAASKKAASKKAASKKAASKKAASKKAAAKKAAPTKAASKKAA